MSQQMTEVAESELICEKLLGWERLGGAAWSVVWNDKTALGQQWPRTPTFTAWAEAGLILDALRSRGTDPSLEYREGKWDCYGGDPYESFFHAYADTGPLAVRAAALEYIKALQS